MSEEDRVLEALERSAEHLEKALGRQDLAAVAQLVQERGGWIEVLSQKRTSAVARDETLSARLMEQNRRTLAELEALRDLAAQEIDRIRRSRSRVRSNRSAPSESRFISERC